MIIFFGPAGAGKSVQGQMLAARQGWRWLSAGQLLRDAHNPEITKELQTGQLVATDTVNNIMSNALSRAQDIHQVILDGFPRLLEQAQWLVASQPEHGRAISLVVVLDVPKPELLKRLMIRGRADDEPEAIEQRLNIYNQEVNPILEYFESQTIAIEHIDGNGTVGQVHDRIQTVVEAHNLT